MEFHRIYVSGLPPDIPEQELRQRFFRSLSLVSVDRKEKPTISGEPKVFAFVTVEGSLAEVTECIEAYNQSKWKGRIITMQIAQQSYLDRLKEEQKMVKSLQSKQKSTTAVAEDKETKKVAASSTVKKLALLQDDSSSSDEDDPEDHPQCEKRQRSEDDDESDSGIPELKKFRGLRHHFGSVTRDLSTVQTEFQQLNTDSPNVEMESPSLQDFPHKRSRIRQKKTRVNCSKVKDPEQDGIQEVAEVGDGTPEEISQDNRAANLQEDDEQPADFSQYDDVDVDSRFLDVLEDKEVENTVNHHVKITAVSAIKPQGVQPFRLVRRYEPPAKGAPVSTETAKKPQEIAQDTTSSTSPIKRPKNLAAEVTAPQVTRKKEELSAEDQTLNEKLEEETAVPKSSKKSKKKKKKSKPEVLESPENSKKKSVSFAPEVTKKTGVSINLKLDFKAPENEGFKFLTDSEPAAPQAPALDISKVAVFRLREKPTFDSVDLEPTLHRKSKVKPFFKASKDDKAEIQNFRNKTEEVSKPNIHKAFKMMRRRKKN